MHLWHCDGDKVLVMVHVIGDETLCTGRREGQEHSPKHTDNGRVKHSTSTGVVGVPFELSWWCGETLIRLRGT